MSNKLPKEIIVKVPEDSIIIDERGSIEKLLDDIPARSLLIIKCNKGSIRANHFHRKDWHFSILMKGELNYYERPVGSTEKPIKVNIKEGQVFFTKPMVEHCMEFLENSQFACLCRLPRDKKSYEEDTVRLNYDLSKI